MENEKPLGLPLTYKFGDVTNLTDSQAGQYNYVVDKGTLDAIAVDSDEATVKKCNQYFGEMIRILNKNKGVFVIVSLLQPHVFKILLDFFVKQEGMSAH